MNFKLNGQRGRYNIRHGKTPSTDKLKERLVNLFNYDSEREAELDLSSVVCNPCFRKLERLEKALEELRDAQKLFEEVKHGQIKHEYVSVRTKRCLKLPETSAGLLAKRQSASVASPLCSEGKENKPVSVSPTNS